MLSCFLHSFLIRLRAARHAEATSYQSVVLIVVFLQIGILALAQTSGPRSREHPRLLSEIRLPLSFEPNRGQMDHRVRYRSRGSGYEILLTDSEAAVAIAAYDQPIREPRTAAVEPSRAVSIMRMKLKGARPTTILGENVLPGKVNYIRGNDPKKWHMGIETYKRVRYASVYSGVDLVYYGNGGQLEYDFIVKPGADANQIRILFSGITGLHLDKDGNLVLQLPNGQVAFRKPVAYQDINGTNRGVASGFVMASENTVAFALGRYDHSRPVVIDPVLVYSTYLGGDFFDAIQALAVDQYGNTYVTGGAYSCDFPTTQGSYEPSLPNCGAPQGAIFVSKINPQGTGLVYSTFVTDGNPFGYSGRGWAIAVDGSGNAYVGGESAGGLPVTPGAYQSVNNASAIQGINGFIFKLDSSGTSLLYSTYLGGGDGGDRVQAIAIDSTGQAYVAGVALSIDFPFTAGAFQTVDETPTYPYSFVSKLNSSGTALLYSTYLVGHGVINPFSVLRGQANGIAIDGSGDAYVVGLTSDESFPVTAGSFQPSYSTNSSNLGLFRETGYIVKLDASGSRQIYSSFLGGDYLSEAQAVAVDGTGSAYVTGWTAGGNITTNGAFQSLASGLDAYVVKVNPSGSVLSYATYLGGSCQTGRGQDAGDAGFAMTIDSSGDAYVAGQTCSQDFPITDNAIQTTLVGNNTNYSVFLSELNPTGNTLLYSTYLGGSYTGDWAAGIGLDAQQNVYIAGLTHSFAFPVTSGAFQTQNNASNQGAGFVSKLTIPTGGRLVVHDFALSLSSSSATISMGQTASTIITITPSNGFYESVSLNCSVPASLRANCSILPPMITPGTSPGTATLALQTFASTSRSHNSRFPYLPVMFAAAVFSVFGNRQRRTMKFLLLGTLVGTFLVSGCGSGTGSGGGGGGSSSYAVTITASCTSKQRTTNFTVTVN